MNKLALGLILLAAVPPSARADCPENHVSAGAAGHALQYDLTTAEGNFEGIEVRPGGPCVACYSWPHGYFRASGYAATDWGASVGARERFELVGPASGPPLMFSARLRVSGSVEPRAEGSVGIGEGSNPMQVLNVPGGQSPSNVPIVLGLEHLPGDSFEIHVSLGVGSNQPYAAADLRASFAFVDVPAGWSIVSCHGIDVPVPNRPTTWGRLRAIYR